MPDVTCDCVDIVQSMELNAMPYVRHQVWSGGRSSKSLALIPSECEDEMWSLRSYTLHMILHARRSIMLRSCAST